MPQTLSTSSFKTKVLRILAVLVTVALIAGGIWVHSRMVRRIDISNDKTTFFENTNYDVLFFGTSHVRMGISPFQLYKDYGITSYNLGTDCQYPIYSYYALKNAISYHKPRIAMIDVYNCNTTVSSKREDLSECHKLFDNFKISKNKICSIENLYETQDIKGEFIFPYMLYHNCWSEISIKDLFTWRNRNIINKNKGYHFSWLKIERDVEKYKNLEWISRDCYLDDKNVGGIEYVKKFVTFCIENNIQPVLMYLPPADGEIMQKQSNSVQKLADELNVPYYNMLYNTDDIIDVDIDMYDNFGHLDFSGARKVTDYIGNILRNDFNVPDHRGEAAYAKWDEDYKVYRNCIFSQMRGLNDFDTLLMSCNFADISVKLFTAKNVSFDNVEQKLIAQLKDNIEIIPVSDEEADYALRIVITDDVTGEMITEKSFNIGSAFHAK